MFGKKTNKSLGLPGDFGVFEGPSRSTSDPGGTAGWILMGWMAENGTLPETNSSPQKRDYFNRKYIFQSHQLSGAKMLVSGRVTEVRSEIFKNFMYLLLMAEIWLTTWDGAETL